MNQRDIECALALAPDADTGHEDARGWYDSYGWHLSTDAEGDVCLQAVEYDWLDDAATARAKLLEEIPELTDDEADAIVGRAADVRSAAEAICSLLDDAVAAYEAGNLEACRRALLDAYRIELAHGDAPATQSLAAELLTSTVIRWRVYHAPDGCDTAFVGEYATLEEAEESATAEPGGLPKALWDTARAAGHCAGMAAPEGGEEDEEPYGWYGEEGWHCIVRVTYAGCFGGQQGG